MKFADGVMMTLISDTFAILLCTGLLTLSNRNRERKNFEDKCFFRLSLMILITAIADMTAYLLQGRDYAHFKYPVILLYTVEYILFVAGIWEWMIYIDFQIYKKPDHLKRMYKPLLIPVAVIVGLFLVNIFTGFIFEVDEKLVLCYRTWYYPLVVVETAGFLYPAFVIYRYSKRNRTSYFVKAWPVMIPVLLDVFVSSATLYSATALSFSSSLTFLYFFMMNRWRFVDEKTGFYNTAYLDFLKKQKKEGKRDYRFILLFLSDIRDERLCTSLKENAPTGSDIIRESDGRYLLCTNVTNRSILSDLGELIAAEDPDSEIKFDILDFDSYKLTEG